MGTDLFCQFFFLEVLPDLWIEWDAAWPAEAQAWWGVMCG